MLRSFTEGILRTHKEKPERDTLCISEDFSAVRAQKRPVKPYIFLSQAAFGVLFQPNPYWMGVTVMVWMWGRCSTMIRPFLSMGVASVQILSTMSMPSVT